MTSPLELSIIVALKDSAVNLPRLLALLGHLPDDCELLICCAGKAPELPQGKLTKVINAPAKALIPHLWRDGIRAARGRRIALTTAQFIPAADWLQRSRDADIERWAGIGGAIANDPAASPANWAIYFLRYSAFAPPLAGGRAQEIAADNAVYDRAAIMACPDLLEDGFWEPSFHRRFHAAGRAICLDPDLIVTHHGAVTMRAFASQRRAHGREYGLERGKRAPPLRAVGLLLRSPALPLLIVARVVGRVWARANYRRHLVKSLPWLLVFALAWSMGEASGYATAIARRPPPDPRVRQGKRA